ncbi:hypothetical protein THOM_2205 [Trachipleistophora hominis]|uniref:Uncharacterized protein n=1 Tax=Trachipleistophora hominis TaxID=72359 RepID=L7JU63_TRAHO|nr:hypothetical protein THOM_2205 [Trachipleistophora hominis]
MNKKFEEGYREAFEDITNDLYFARGFVLRNSDLQLNDVLSMDDGQILRMYRKLRNAIKGSLDW